MSPLALPFVLVQLVKRTVNDYVDLLLYRLFLATTRFVWFDLFHTPREKSCAGGTWPVGHVRTVFSLGRIVPADPDIVGPCHRLRDCASFSTLPPAQHSRCNPRAVQTLPQFSWIGMTQDSGPQCDIRFTKYTLCSAPGCEVPGRRGG